VHIGALGITALCRDRRYNSLSVDGINEKGLVANLLYLATAKYPEENGKPVLPIGAWVQFTLE
jgi:penicillin V acylase-like amidase (Ntn superfamily)